MGSVFYRLVGGLLLLAAGLKLKQLLETPVLGEAAFSLHFWGALHAQFEIVVGAVLVSGIAPRWNRALTLTTFGVFTGVSGVQALQGLKSCGCFGDVTLDPFAVFLLDLGILAIALSPVGAADSSATVDRGKPWMRTTLFILLIGLGAAGVAGCVQYWEPMRLGVLEQFGHDGDAIRPDHRFYAIDPDSLLDRTFTLAEHMTEGQALLQGNWVVVFHRPRCPHCELTLERVVEQGMAFFRAPANARLCLVDLSGLGKKVEANPGLAAVQPPVLESTLSHDYRWVVETPLVVYLANGVVVACADYENLMGSQ